VDLTTVIDCTGANLGTFDIPPGVLMAGYATGTGDVPWSDAQWAAHPNAIRIDQWPTSTPAGATADLIDVENGAVTIDDVPQRVIDAKHSWLNADRPGQRRPAVYVEQSEVTPVVNALVAAGLTSNVPLFLTEPMPEHAAIDLVTGASGPFPIVGVQYAFQSHFDVSVVSTAWLKDVSKAPGAPTPKPGTQSGWRYCSQCTSLFYGPGVARSMCPRGGQHDGSQSHDYVLGFDQ